MLMYIIIIFVCICLLYYTCNRFGFFVNFILYIGIMGLLPILLHLINLEEISLWFVLFLRVIFGVSYVNRLLIINERIGSPLAFFLTAIILEGIFTFVLVKFTKYIILFSVVYGIFALISIFKVAGYEERLNSGMWMTGNSFSPEGRIEINNVKAKSNLFGKWFR